MSKKSKIILMAIFAGVLIGGAVLIWRSSKLAEIPASPANDTTSDVVQVMQSAFKTYTHPVYDFSFEYPASWDADIFEDEDGEVLVVQNSETGILIYIYPFDEPGPISKERVLKDVPDMRIADGKQIKIAGLPAGEAGAIDALSFDSDEREIGPTKEVWFVRGGFLYQISAAEGSETGLEKIVNTWKFN